MERSLSFSELHEENTKNLRTHTKLKPSVKMYTGRRSYGCAASKVRRKKSKNDRNQRQVDFDFYNNKYDEAFYQSIPTAAHVSSPPITQSPISQWEESSSRLKNSDRNELNKRVTQLISKKYDKRHLEVTQAIGDCAYRGKAAVEIIIGKKGAAQYSFANILWLALKVYQNGRTEDECSEEDGRIAVERARCIVIVEEIAKFQFDKLCESCSCSTQWRQKMELSNIYLMNIRRASARIETILTRFDNFIELFPNRKALWEVIEAQTGKEKRRKIEIKETALRVWMNTLNDVCDKLESIGIILKTHKCQWIQPLDEKNHVFTIDDIAALIEAFVKNSLNINGMKKVISRIEELLEVTVIKSAILMRKRPNSYANATAAPTGFSLNSIMKQRYLEHEKWRFCDEPSRSMGLPSLEPLLLFLLAIPMQLTMQWLEVRCDKKATTDDELTLDAIITDTRDCVEKAVRIKRNYMQLLQMMCLKCAVPRFLYPKNFEESVSMVFKAYIESVHQWTNCETVQSNLAMLFERIEAEWNAALHCATSIRFGINSLCETACNTISKLLKVIIEDYAGSEMVRYHSELTDADAELTHPDKEEGQDDLSDVSFQQIPMYIKPTTIYARCVHSLIREINDRELRMFKIIRLMIKQVRDSVGYELKNDSEKGYDDFLKYLANEFCWIKMVKVDDNGMKDELLDDSKTLLVDKETADKALVENNLLAIFEGRKFDEGCIVAVPCSTDHVWRIWNGRVTEILIDGDNLFSCDNIRSDRVVVMGSEARIEEFERKYLKYLQKTTPLCVSNKLVDAIWHQFTRETLLPHMINLHEKFQLLIDNYEKNPKNDSLKAAIQKWFLVAFQTHRDVALIISEYYIDKEAEYMIDTALRLMTEWINFVESFCEPSNLVPMWAKAAFNFLHFFTEPKWTKEGIMSEEQFSKLTRLFERFENAIIRKNCVPITPNVLKNRIQSPRSLSSSSGSTAEHNSMNMMDKLNQIEMKREEINAACFPVGRILGNDDEQKKLNLDRLEVLKPPFEWSKLNKIGSGSYGEVYRALSSDNRIMAAKVINVTEKIIKSIVDEINIFRKLNHSNLVKYYGFEISNRQVIIFMEYCSQGTLEKICESGMSLQIARPYTNSLLQGVKYLHDQKIVHGDIKPGNIFLDPKCVLKLGDFGSAFRLSSDATLFGEMCEVRGTCPFMAPEIFTYGKNDEGMFRGYGRSVDIWAVGCTVVQMLTGQTPWKGLNLYQITYSVCENRRKPKYPAEAKDDVIEFLDMCFEYYPENRATAEKLLRTTFANVNMKNDYKNQL